MPPEQCVILLGGLGTRLGELTRETPKPLLPVGDSPFVDVLAREAVRRGFRRLLLLAGFRSDAVMAYADALRSRLPAGYSVAVSVESEPLGTGGALLHATDLLEERFLLLNGDTWFDFNWLDLSLLADGNVSALAARWAPASDRYESLAIEGGEVTALIPRGASTGDGNVINGGVYCLRKSDLTGFPDRFSLEQDLLPKLIEESKLHARVYDGFFLDIGIPETYQAAQTVVPAQQRRPALFLDRDGVLNHDEAYVGTVERFRWIEGAKDAVRFANDLGWYVFVVTNQAGVAHGHYSENDVHILHRWIGEELRVVGAHIDDWRYCPYHPEGAVEAYRAVHPWRKPSPGMIDDLMNHWPVDKAASLMIGDQETDMRAAKAAGIASARFTGGNLLEFVRAQPAFQ